MEKKVFVLATDFVSEVAKVVFGQYALQLQGWLEMTIALVALVTLVYGIAKFFLAIPVVKHLVTGCMAFCLAEAVLATITLFRSSFLTMEQIFGLALAFAGICLVLSIRRSRREAQQLTWMREYNNNRVADAAESAKPIDDGIVDQLKALEERVTKLEVEADSD